MRSVLKKLLTAMRGSVNELGEAVVDTQGNRILEQELRDSEQELKQAKQELAGLMAEVASPTSGYCAPPPRSTPTSTATSRP